MIELPPKRSRKPKQAEVPAKPLPRYEAAEADTKASKPAAKAKPQAPARSSIQKDRFTISCVCGTETKTHYLTGICEGCGRRWNIKWDDSINAFPSTARTLKFKQ